MHRKCPPFDTFIGRGCGLRVLVDHFPTLTRYSEAIKEIEIPLIIHPFDN